MHTLGYPAGNLHSKAGSRKLQTTCTECLRYVRVCAMTSESSTSTIAKSTIDEEVRQRLSQFQGRSTIFERTSFDRDLTLCIAAVVCVVHRLWAAKACACGCDHCIGVWALSWDMRWYCDFRSALCSSSSGFISHSSCQCLSVSKSRNSSTADDGYI